MPKCLYCSGTGREPTQGQDSPCTACYGLGKLSICIACSNKGILPGITNSKQTILLCTCHQLTRIRK